MGISETGRRSKLLAGAFALAILPKPARAQAPAPAPMAVPQISPRYFPVVVQGTPGVQRTELKVLQIAGLPEYEDTSDGFRCDGPCSISVPAGIYRLRVTQSNGRVSERKLTLSRPERLDVGPVDTDARDSGLIMGISGSVMVPVGIAMMLFALPPSTWARPTDKAAEDEGDPALMISGLGVLTTGCVLAPIGWILYAKNTHFSLKRTPLAWPGYGYGKSAGPTLSLKLSPTKGDGSLHLTLAF